jgi:hypothetical protein
MASQHAGAAVNATVNAQMATCVAEIEHALQQLDDALCGEAFDAIDVASQGLQRSLGEAVNTLGRSRQPGQAAVLSADVLRRLGLARQRANLQQAAVQRTLGSLERTLHVLLPREDGAATYGALGQSPVAKALSAYR